MTGVFRVLGKADAATERFVDSALASGGIGVWAWLTGTDRVRWSARQAQLHGIAPDYFDGSIDDHLALVHPADRDAVRAAIYDVDSDRSRVTYRSMQDGTTCWLESRWEPDHDDMRVGVTIDVSAAKRAERRAEREARILAGLHDATTSLVRSRGLEQTLQSVTESVAELLNADAAVTVCRDAHEAGSYLRVAVDTDLAGDLGDAGLAELVARADLSFHQSQILVEADIELAGEAGTLRRILGDDASRYRSGITAPIRSHGSVIGLIVLLADRPKAFNAEDRRIFGAVAAQTSTAIPAAAEFERQASAVVLLQERLLPSEDVHIEHFETCVRYRPADDDFAVGGDWFDVLEPDPGHAVAIVGDTRGHGLLAATHMAELRFSFRSLVTAGLAVPVALQQLNDLCRNRLGTTATVIVAELWADTGDVHIWSAGHLPAVIGSPGGHRFVDDDRNRCPMLGLADTLSPRPTVDTIAAGEVLVLYTDGLIETRAEHIDDSLGRLAEQAATVADGPLESWCDGLIDALVESGRREDDTSLVGMRFRPES